ncbi:MAG: PAS-domain containing protein [Proteobacteria bacterium]|nr:PAS-domain containing protein [Pseudomonadota bacterium]
MTDPSIPTLPSSPDAFDESHLSGLDPLRLRRWVLALVALIGIVVASVFLYSVQTAKERNEDAATRQAATLTRAIEEHAGKSFGAAGRTLASLAGRVAGGWPENPKEMLSIFNERRDLVPGAVAAFAVDADGHMRIDTADGSDVRADPAVSTFLRTIRQAAYGVMVVSYPVYKPLLDSWHIYLARSFHGWDGAYAGTVVLTIDLDYFREFHASLDVGPNGRISLWRDDGMLLWRQPVDPALIGRTFGGPLTVAMQAGERDGAMLVGSPIDGIERRLTWRQIAGTPIFASVALATDDYRQTLRVAMHQQTVAAGVGAVLVLALAGLVYFQLGRMARLAALARLDRDRALQSQRQLRGVIDAIPGIINAKDENGRYTLMNVFQARIFGTTPEDAIGKRLEDFADRAFAREVEVRERVAMRTRTTSHGVEDTFTIDGVRRSFLASKVPIVDPDGIARHIVSVATDVSAMKSIEQKARAAEAQLRAALDSIPEGFAIYDEKDRLMVSNRPYALMFTEHGDPARIRGETFEALVRRAIQEGEQPEPGFDAEGWVAERVRRHQSPDAEPYLMKTGSGRWISVSEQRVPGIGIVGVRTDVTRLVDTEAALRQARDQAEAANRAKSQFLANMSHELRTPLNAIIGFSEIIEKQFFGPAGNPRYVEYAHDIAASGRHLVSLIGDVLDMSKIEAGRLDLEETDVDPLELIDSSAALVRGEAATRGVRVTQDTASLAGVTLRADARALRQVLLNLLSNAIKFTPQGGRVDVRAQRASGGIEIAVADTGVGIPAADLPHVTEPFRQAPGSAAQYGGTGLGLSITKRLIEMHQGRLEIQSTLGKGTTVRVWLPAGRISGTRAA